MGGSGWVVDILDLVSACKICLFMHTKREANMMAHNISKAEGEVGNLMLWDGILPSFML